MAPSEAEDSNAESIPMDSPSNGSDEDYDICPVCLCQPSAERPFCRANCDHKFCVPCVERILLTKQRPSSSSLSSQQDELHLSAPTKGRCPYCRKELSLFELRKCESEELLLEKNTDRSTWPMEGAKYRDEMGKISIDFTKYIISFGGQEVPFDGSFHYHDKSRTLHGRVDLQPKENSIHGPNSVEVLLQFASDFRFVCAGTVIIWFDPEQNYLLDGKWVVQLPPNVEASVSVNHHTFVLLGKRYFVAIKEGQKAKIYSQAAEDVVAFSLETITSERPARLQWTREGTSRNLPGEVFDIMKWNFVSAENIGINPFEVDLVGPGALVILRESGGRAADRARPSYHGASIWGNTYCQAFKVGLASYQFLSEENGAYISYEHPMTGQWPPLDDGSPVPARVFFRGASFDSDTRTFRGRIQWQNDFGTNWQGCREWIYEMVFNPDFTYIASGTVWSIPAHSDEPQEMSVFGSDLIYINAAMDEKFEELKVSSGEDEMEEPLNEQYSRLSRQMRQQWQEQNASVRSIAMLHRVLTAVLSDQVYPVDFNLS